MIYKSMTRMTALNQAFYDRMVIMDLLLGKYRLSRLYITESNLNLSDITLPIIEGVQKGESSWWPNWLDPEL